MVLVKEQIYDKIQIQVFEFIGKMIDYYAWIHVRRDVTNPVTDIVDTQIWSLLDSEINGTG